MTVVWTPNAARSMLETEPLVPCKSSCEYASRLHPMKHSIIFWNET